MKQELTKEERLIQEFLKKNKPKKVDESVIDLSLYERGYLKLTKGKCCSYCGTKLNENNVYIKPKPNVKMVVTEVVVCKECNSLPEKDKKILNKVDYVTYLEIKALLDGLDYITNVFKNKISTFKERLKEVKFEYRYSRFSKKQTEEKELKIKSLNAKIDECVNTIKSNTNNVNNQITELYKKSKFKLKKYKMDYYKISFIKEIDNDNEI